MDEWAEAILRTLSPTGAPMRLEDFLVLVSQTRQMPRNHQFDGALSRLTTAQLVGQHGGVIYRTEPDFDERSLEISIAAELVSEGVCSALRITPAESVFADTMRGGIVGGGRWSRPDFTIAAIRRWRFDPLRQLDVFSFELKNRAAADVVAVHEALAHTRFSHYAYLVCPRSSLQPKYNVELGEECARHGVGLFLFDLAVAADGRPGVGAFQLELAAARSNATPERVEQHLEERLPEALKKRLFDLARAP